MDLDSGAEVQRQRAAKVDSALADLSTAAGGELGIVAVGGYGRGELAPHSDIDLLILSGPRSDGSVTKAALRDLLYPLWDAGFQVGHAVVDPKAAVERCKGDFHAATSLLSARLIAGAPELFEELLDRRARWISKERRAVARQIIEAAQERRVRRSFAGWTLAPDIKEDVGGLRDLHSVGWLAELSDELTVPEEARRAGDILLAAREGLHAEVPRRNDQLRIDLQPKVARRLGLGTPGGPDLLMQRVHSAARTIEWSSLVFLRTVLSALEKGPKRSGTSAEISEGMWLRDGEVTIDPGLPADSAHGFQALGAVSRTGRPLRATSTLWLKDALGAPHWTESARTEFLHMLEGEHTEIALRMMDHLGLWPSVLPEWEQVRGRAQHDLYHRYTVDGHLFRCASIIDQCIAEDVVASNAADELLTSDAGLFPLRLAALLHDIGKGSAEDHSIAGERLCHRALTRMGFGDDLIDVVTKLIRNHLLLADTATRRDIDDGAVIENVARSVGTPEVLRYLLILSQADGRATGPEAWTAWKASLVNDLYHRVLHALETGGLPARRDVSTRLRELEGYDPVLSASANDLLQTLPPSYISSTDVEIMAEELHLLMRSVRQDVVGCLIEPDPTSGQASITLALGDRPGTLARAAGVLALHRMSVLRANAYASTSGKALQRFEVKAPKTADWAKVEADIQAVYSSRLALEARLEKKIADYLPSAPIEPEIRTLGEEALHSTVIEVRALDALGLLYAITRAIEDLDLDIHVAKIDTLGDRVVDVFYVRTLSGEKLDPVQAAEVETAIVHRIRRLLS